MSWILSSINFDSYGVIVLKSDGVLNLPVLATEGTNWLDAAGLDYWQASQIYNERIITLQCLMAAEATEVKTGYEAFVDKLNVFYGQLLNKTWGNFATPYHTITNCIITGGISVNRETNYNEDLQIGTFTLTIKVKRDDNFVTIPVYDWNTFAIKAYLVTNNMTVNRTLQGDSFVNCTFDINTPPIFHIWDYVLINTNGANTEPYYFLYEPEMKKISTNKFTLPFRLEHGSILLKQAVFLNSAGEADFYMFANLDEIVDLIVTCGNRFIGATKFVKGGIATTTAKLHKFDCENCYDLLKRLASEYELEYIILWLPIGTLYEISVQAQIATTKAITLEYGKGNGLYELDRGAPNRSELVTTLYAYGSNKNLPMDYARGNRLQFAGNPLVKNVASYMGIEKAVIWEDIKPERKAAVQAYYQKLVADLTEAEKQVHPNGIFRITDNTIDFSLDKNYGDGTGVLLGGVTAKVTMQTGDCMGMTFEITQYDPVTFEIFLIQFRDEMGNLFPNATVRPRAIEEGHPVADIYSLIDIAQPTSYIATAETALQVAAQAYLDSFSVLKYPFHATLHPAFTDAMTGGKFEVGDRITVIDSDIGVSGLQRISEFVYDVYKRTYTLTLQENKILSYRERIKIVIDTVERTMGATGANDAEVMRSNQTTTKELKNNLLAPEDEMLQADDIVRSESIDPRMLAYDAGAPLFSITGAIVSTNYENVVDRVRIDAGTFIIHNWAANTLNRYDIDQLIAGSLPYDPTRTWIIPATTLNLATSAGYFLYLKIDISGISTAATLEANASHVEIKRYIRDEFLYFKLGYINAGTPRVASMLWGLFNWLESVGGVSKAVNITTLEGETLVTYPIPYASVDDFILPSPIIGVVEGGFASAIPYDVTETNFKINFGNIATFTLITYPI